MKFLIIDDQPDDRASIIQALQPFFAEAEFIQVGRPDEFEIVLPHNNFDLALTDDRLGWTDGIDVVKTLKRQWPYLPIIMVAQPGNEIAAIEGLKAGMSDYISKDQLPCLPEAVQRSLEQARLRRKQEIALLQAQQSAHFYQALCETISDYAYINRVEPEGKLVTEWLNDTFTNLTGYTLKEVNEQGWPSVIYPADLPLFEQHIKQALAGQADLSEFRLLGKDRQIYWVLETCLPLWDEQTSHVTRIYGVAQDITRRKQAEEKIKRRNRELTLLNQIIAASTANSEAEVLLETACRELALALDTPRSTASLFDEAKRETRVVAEYRVSGYPSMLGVALPIQGNPLSQNLLIHQSPLVVHNVQQDPRLVPIRKMLAQYDTAAMPVLPMAIDNEIVGSLSLETSQPRHFSGEEINLAWSVADQVAGALARGRLAQARQRLSAAIEQAADNIIITDLEGKIVYVNPAFERISGYNRAEVIGQTPRFLNSDQPDHQAYYDGRWSTLAAGRVWRGRLTNKRKDDTWYTEDVTICPVRNEDGAIVSYVASQRDVTRELNLEEQLRQSQKMEAVGQLAGGVAHDFNNLLTVITGYSELLLNRLVDNSDTQHSYLDEIHKASERAAKLTRQLLAFSRKQVLLPEILDLNEVIAGVAKMLRRIIGEDIEVTTSLSPSLDLVKADPGQLEQVIMNLVINARDAMPYGGRLVLETANVTLDETYVRHHVEVEPGPYVMLAVSDTGTGIDKEIQSHIFEPFFTTKGPGKGTGLGLATVHGIVKQSGGHVWVYSEPGQGTTFKVYLPQVQAVVEKIDQPPIPKVYLHGTETILVVEDDSSVRTFISQVLSQSGYKLLEAAGSAEALLLYRQQPDPIDLLLVDMILPVMNGLELAKQLTLRQPNLKVLYISGYTDNAILSQGIFEPGLAFLQKPFTPETLRRKIREVLGIFGR